MLVNYERTEGVVPGGDDEHHAEGLRRDPRRRRERQHPAGDLHMQTETTMHTCRYDLLLQYTLPHSLVLFCMQLGGTMIFWVARTATAVQYLPGVGGVR